MVAAFLLNNEQYNVELATENDIELAYATVESIVADTPKYEYTMNMLRSVMQGSAWKLVRDSEVEAWLWLSQTDGVWSGDMFWGKDAITISLLWRYVNLALGDIRVRFMPHKGQLSAVKSLATGKSIRLMHNGKPYVVVDTADLRRKCELLHDKIGVKCLV